MRDQLMQGRRMSSRARRSPLATCAYAALSLVLAACGDIFSLKQENPGQLSTETLYVPANAQLLTNGAIADFECAFARYVVGSGLLMDELITAIAQTANYDYERRTIPPNALGYGTNTCAGTNQQPGIYTNLSLARAGADTAMAKMEGWTDAEVPNRTRLIGQLAAYAGYSLTLLGEGMCSAAINLSAEMTPDDLFEQAEGRFDEAITAASAANDAQTLNFARLGRARARQNLGRLTEAAADAALIPSSFVANISTDSDNPRRQNFVFVHTGQNFHSSIDPSFRDVQLNGAPDPRVLVTNTTRAGTAPNVIVWTANKYPTRASPISIAKYAQAQLIVAEERAAAGDLVGAQDAINRARNTRADMPQYDATGQTQAQVRAQVIEERRRELFLEGHRMGDIRRYGLQLNPAPNSAYTTGGGNYGAQDCFPLPDVERINNPNIQ